MREAIDFKIAPVLDADRSIAEAHWLNATDRVTCPFLSQLWRSPAGYLVWQLRDEVGSTSSRRLWWFGLLVLRLLIHEMATVTISLSVAIYTCGEILGVVMAVILHARQSIVSEHWRMRSFCVTMLCPLFFTAVAFVVNIIHYLLNNWELCLRSTPKRCDIRRQSVACIADPYRTCLTHELGLMSIGVITGK